MAQPIKLHDLGALLADLAEGATDTGLTVLDESPHSVLSLLVVSAGDRWDGGRADGEERRVIVLEGMATFTVDNVRQSLGSGHAVAIEPGAQVLVSNEAQEPLRAVHIESPPRAKLLTD